MILDALHVFPPSTLMTVLGCRQCYFKGEETGMERRSSGGVVQSGSSSGQSWDAQTMGPGRGGKQRKPRPPAPGGAGFLGRHPCQAVCLFSA